ESKAAESAKEAKQKIRAALDSGEALERFRQNIELQSGDPRVCDKPEKLLAKGLEVSITAPASGFIKAVDTFAIGSAISEIGGGRTRAEDKNDHAVGYGWSARIGEKFKGEEAVGGLYIR